MTYGAGLSPTSIAMGDLDGDGDRDRDLAVVLSVGPSEGDLLILLNDGDGTFAEHATYTIQNLLRSVAFSLADVRNVGANPDSIAMGDLDGDGDLDLATANDKHPQPAFRRTVTELELPPPPQ